MSRIEVSASSRILVRLVMIFAAGLASLSAVGCASARYVQVYDGPPRGEEQAIIKGNRMRGWRIGIMKVDGEFSVSPFITAASGKWPNSVGVLPGKHTVRANLQYKRSWGGEMDLWWIARARSTYTIYANSKETKFRLWIVDDATHQTVGGLVGSSDEPK